MSYYDLPTVVKCEINKAMFNKSSSDDFPIVIYRGVFCYTFWAYDLPVEKYRIYGSR